MLFDPVSVGNIELKNRFVRSATYDGGADRKGRVTGWQLGLYDTLARGGAGLIVTGMFSVHPSGRIAGNQNILSADTSVDGMKRLAETVHGHGARIVAQIAHCGREAHGYQAYLGRPAAAPSVLEPDVYFSHPHRALAPEEIEEIVEAFGEAALRAKRAGLDGVQVHGAHAYLVSQFLSPHTNRRTDRWGGSFEGRFRFVKAVYRAIRRRVGNAYPVMIKLGVADGFAGGLCFEAGRIVARRCADLGFDAIEISQGLRGRHYAETEFRTGITAGDREAYFRQWTARVRRRSTVPVVMVGGLRSLAVIRQMVETGQADLVAVSRPLICEPGLIAQWRAGRRQASRCVSCNRCFEALLKGRRLGCAVAARRRKTDAVPVAAG